MQERILPRGWFQRRSIERHCDADNPIQIIGAALCAYGKPTFPAFAQRGLLMALTLRVLMKLNRSRSARSRQIAPHEVI